MNEEKQQQNIEVTGGGLQCDNPKCDWKDISIPFEYFKSWINQPCPKCGENVLTYDDYKNAETLMASVGIINQMTAEEIEALAEMAGGIEEMKNNPMLKDAKGIENLNEEGGVEFTVVSHKEIKIVEITPRND